MTEPSRVTAARTRAKHPDRYELSKQIQYAGDRARRKLAARYAVEFEELWEAECKEAGIPRFMPPLSRDKDGRGRWRRAAVEDDEDTPTG